MKKDFFILKKIKNVNVIIIVLFLLILITSIISHKFLSVINIMNILRQISTIGIMAFGVSFVMIGGNIDLSIGSILTLCGLISCKLTAYGAVVAILIPLIVGFICGTLNGIFVGKIKFNSFITTLGTMSIFQAIAYIYSDNNFLNATNNFFYSQVGKGFFYKIPIPVFILIFFFLIFLYLSKETVFGRQLYVVGANPECAKFSGINNEKIIILAYASSGFCAAVSSIIFVSRQMAAQPEMGAGYEFGVLVAVVVGGISLSGGKGNLYQAMLGVIFIGVLKNSFILLGILLYYQYVVMGVVLIFTLGISNIKEKEK